MKLFVISDIHGSLKYASLALKAYESSKADKLIILGDFYYHGPRNPLPEGYMPKSVCELLNPLKDQIIAIKGNCDAEVDEYISAFPFQKEVRLEANGKRILCAHGHHEADLTAVDIYLSGHTHIAVLKKEGGIIYANPGSVSLPKADNSQNYLLLDEKGLRLISLITGEEISYLPY